MAVARAGAGSTPRGMLDAQTMQPWPLDEYARRLMRRGHRRVHFHDGVWWTGHGDWPIAHALDPFLRLPRDVRPSWRHAYLGRRRLIDDPTRANAHYNPMVLDDLPRYGLERLSERRRRGVRKGLKRVTVRPITPDELARDGWRIEMEGHRRNGWRRPPPRAAWPAHVAATYRAPIVDHKIGAFVGDRLVAYVCWYGVVYPSTQPDGVVQLPHLASSDEGLQLSAIDAILYTLLGALRDRGGYRCAINSIHSHRASLDAFKDSHGFRMQALPAELTLRPLVRPLLARFRPESLALLVGLDPERTHRWMVAARAPAPSVAAAG